MANPQAARPGWRELDLPKCKSKHAQTHSAFFLPPGERDHKSAPGAPTSFLFVAVNVSSRLTSCFQSDSPPTFGSDTSAGIGFHSVDRFQAKAPTTSHANDPA